MRRAKTVQSGRRPWVVTSSTRSGSTLSYLQPTKKNDGRPWGCGGRNGGGMWRAPLHRPTGESGGQDMATGRGDAIPTTTAFRRTDPVEPTKAAEP